MTQSSSRLHSNERNRVFKSVLYNSSAFR